jgi:hypothetical protein
LVSGAVGRAVQFVFENFGSTGYLDVGAVQHQDAGGASAVLVSKSVRLYPVQRFISRSRIVFVPQTRFLLFSRSPRQIRVRDSSYRRPQSAAVLVLFPIVITSRREVR